MFQPVTNIAKDCQNSWLAEKPNSQSRTTSLADGNCLKSRLSESLPTFFYWPFLPQVLFEAMCSISSLFVSHLFWNPNWRSCRLVPSHFSGFKKKVFVLFTRSAAHHSRRWMKMKPVFCLRVWLLQTNWTKGDWVNINCPKSPRTSRCWCGYRLRTWFKFYHHWGVCCRCTRDCWGTSSHPDDCTRTWRNSSRTTAFLVSTMTGSFLKLDIDSCL